MIADITANRDVASDGVDVQIGDDVSVAGPEVDIPKPGACRSDNGSWLLSDKIWGKISD